MSVTVTPTSCLVLTNIAQQRIELPATVSRSKKRGTQLEGATYMYLRRRQSARNSGSATNSGDVRPPQSAPLSLPFARWRYDCSGEELLTCSAREKTRK